MPHDRWPHNNERPAPHGRGYHRRPRYGCTFSTPAAAQAAKQSLIDSGIAADRIAIIDHAANSAQTRGAITPADPGILGRLREAILPDDSERATRAAVRNDDAVLTVRPLPSEVEMAVGVLRAAEPSHFDADLELWRNAG